MNMMLKDIMRERRELLDVICSDEEFLTKVEQITNAIVDTISIGKRIYVCGNGGSACEAQHFVGELVGRFCRERDPLPAVCLNSDGGILTCIGNDYSFDSVFSRQVNGLMSRGDLLVVLSTSGNSQNIVEALRAANSNGIDTVALLGKDGGTAANYAWLSAVVPYGKTDIIQEVHLAIIHYICHKIDEDYFTGESE